VGFCESEGLIIRCMMDEFGRFEVIFYVLVGGLELGVFLTQADIPVHLAYLSVVSDIRMHHCSIRRRSSSGIVSRRGRFHCRFCTEAESFSFHHCNRDTHGEHGREDKGRTQEHGQNLFDISPKIRSCRSSAHTLQEVLCRFPRKVPPC